MEKTPILLGGLVQAAVVAVLLVAVQPPLAVYAATPAVAGVVGALSSDRFQSEYIDAGGAGMAGILLSLGVAGAVAWQNLSSLPRAVQIDVTLLTVLWTLSGLIFLLPVGLFISVLAGFFSVVARDSVTRS